MSNYYFNILHGTETEKDDQLRKMFRVEKQGLQWTTEPPKKAGWYWVRRKDGKKRWTTIAWYFSNQEDEFENRLFITTHWLGPLPEPEAPKG